jgi:hypothetical protein
MTAGGVPNGTYVASLTNGVNAESDAWAATHKAGNLLESVLNGDGNQRDRFSG